jgi:hypothetical protein
VGVGVGVGRELPPLLPPELLPPVDWRETATVWGPSVRGFRSRSSRVRVALSGMEKEPDRVREPMSRTPLLLRGERSVR